MYGFITIPSDLIFGVIEHPYFQRLRRVKQLGLAELVYPGAVHTRFQHALGAMHLMHEALYSLETKGVEINAEEKEATLLAILLHDIGHGPFSHVLEKTLLDHVAHESVSGLLMEKLNREFDGRLSLAIEIFNGTYSREFFHQLVSGQLDMDRLDYLNRDSFFTAVAEGKIGAERIIKMLDVYKDELVVEEKGLMSVENFLVARQHMYWQVYVHKTAVGGETMLLKIFERLKDLVSTGENMPMIDHLRVFMENDITFDKIRDNSKLLGAFVHLDDYDIWYCIKKWSECSDRVLSALSKNLLNRRLFKFSFERNLNFDQVQDSITSKILDLGLPENYAGYFWREGKLKSSGYELNDKGIKILFKNGERMDITEASELPTVKAISKIVEKRYLCYANDVSLQNL